MEVDHLSLLLNPFLFGLWSGADMRRKIAPLVLLQQIDAKELQHANQLQISNSACNGPITLPCNDVILANKSFGLLTSA